MLNKNLFPNQNLYVRAHKNKKSGHEQGRCLASIFAYCKYIGGFMKLSEDDVLNGVERFEKHCRKYPAFRRLKEKLFNIGGFQGILLHDIPLKTILFFIERGRQFSGKVELRLGLANECHSNCARFSYSDPELQIVLGWALFDGLWHLHSWLTPDGDNIIETIQPFDSYYGYILNEVEKTSFILKNMKDYLNRMRKKITRLRKSHFESDNAPNEKPDTQAHD